MHHRHIKQMARPVLYTLSMLCGFMYTLNVVWCVKSLVWFYVHFLCCAVYSVVLYTLSMLCSVKCGFMYTFRPNEASLFVEEPV